jgi:hypothetical protein
MVAAPSTLAKPRRIRYAPVMKKLMEDRDKEGAIAMLIELSGSSHAYHISNFMKHVRERIARDERYVNKGCIHQVMELMKTPGLNEQDRMKLAEIVESPRKIRWAQVRKGIFLDYSVHERLCQIQVFDPMYYDFVPSPEMQTQLNEYKQSTIIDNHRHSRKTVERYNFTNQEMNEMIQRAISLCENEQLDWTKRKNSLNVLEACALLTGRRKWELCKTLEMRSSPVSDYQAIVSGISKDLKSGKEERAIPLLAPIATVAKGIVKLRRYAHKFGDYYQSKKSKIFPKLTHTTFRDLYCKRAWRDRAVNLFMPDNCSEVFWCSQALCDNLSTYAMHYTTAVIHHGEPGVPDHRDLQRDLERERLELEQQEEMADSSGGSSDNVC